MGGNLPTKGNVAEVLNLYRGLIAGSLQNM
jgi:hypothetical protein